MTGTLTVYHWPMRPIKVKPKNKKELHLRKHKKGNIHGKYKVLMLRGSHKKNSNNKITKSILH